MTYSEVNSHGPLPPTTFLRYLCNKHKTAEGSKHCQRQSMNWRQNAWRLPSTGAIPSPYPMTRLPVGAYLLVKHWRVVQEFSFMVISDGVAVDDENNISLIWDTRWAKQELTFCFKKHRVALPPSRTTQNTREKYISYYWKEGAKQHLQRAHIVFKDVQIDLIAV